MLEYLKKNIESLSRHTLCPLPDKLPDHVAVQPTSGGNVTIKYGDLLIHSSYDPVKEGLTFAKNIARGSAICLYGFGLGYHVGALLDKIGPEGSLLVIELNPDLLASAMMLRDQTALLSDKRLHLVYGTDEPLVAAEISRHMNQTKDSPSGISLVVLFHSPSFKCIPKHFERIGNALEILQMERRVPAIFGDLESENYFFNKDIVGRSPGINTCRDAHKNQSAVLVSAGPSLDDVIPYLGKIGQHCVLACVDTALPVLSREGIFPQYVFSLDPQDESFLYFRADLDNPAKLVYLPTASARVVHSYRGEKIVVFKEGHALFKDNPELMNEKGTTRAGGSVSCLGIDCLLQMGCNPIVMAGQDCAFSGNRTYSRHAIMNETLLDKIYQFKTLASQHMEKMQETKMIQADCMDGQKVFTNQMMYSYLRNIEVLAQSERQIHNLRSHGARIGNVTDLGSINDMMKVLQL